MLNFIGYANNTMCHITSYYDFWKKLQVKTALLIYRHALHTYKRYFSLPYATQ